MKGPQRFISGKPATSAIACRDGQVLAAIHMDVVQMHGETGHASVIRRVDCAEMDRAARLIAARFKLSGLHGLDYMRDGEGVHLLEINPRATQICHLTLGEGRDLPAALLDAQGTRGPVSPSDLIALFPQEWKRDAGSAYLTRCAFRDVLHGRSGTLIAALLPASAPVSPHGGDVFPAKSTRTISPFARH